jgi:NAD-dependent dihydropyrimidine dehydrogenase PreA subunit
MEGNGPGRGDPRHIGLILGGEDGVAVDRVASAILKVNPGSVPTLDVARKRGYGETGLENIALRGEKISDVQIKHLKLPQGAFLEGSRFPLVGILRQLFTAMPYSNPEKCSRCKDCVDICPTGSAVLHEKAIDIDYSTCIRCFCCQEICPEGAIEIKYGYLNRLVRKR